MAGNDDVEPVTKAECKGRHAAIDFAIENLTSTTRRFDLALFGPDGRGGMQHEVSSIHATVLNVQKILNSKEKIELQAAAIDVKRLAIWMSLVSALVGALASIAVAYFNAYAGVLGG